MNLTTSQPEWLIYLQANPIALMGVLSLILFIAGVLFWTHLNYQQRREEAPVDDRQPELQRLVVAQASALKLMSERVSALENYLELMGDKQQIITQTIKPKRAYREAINAAGDCEGDDEIMQRFGLPRPEAQLVSALYGARSA